MDFRFARTRARHGALTAGLVLLALGTTMGQTPLSLEEAIDSALERNASLNAATAAVDAAEAGRAEATGALLPRVDFTESFHRSNNPVFVFGTLLNQRRFAMENFELSRLNDPDPLNLYQSQFRLRQVLFDQEVLLSREHAGVLARMSRESARQAEMETIFAIARAYHGVEVAERNVAVLAQALEGARADQSRAEALVEAGQVTEADLLALQVNASDLTDQIIRARNAVELMRAELNKSMGVPLDESYELTTVLSEPGEAEPEPEEIETSLAGSPRVRQSELREEGARLGYELAKSRFLPRVRFDAAWESDRVSFSGDGGTNWRLGVAVDVNVFDGLSSWARLRAAEAERRQAAATRRDAIETARLELRRAELDREASLESSKVARESVARARESHRINEARYEAGLANVTDLLRSQNALLHAEARFLGALYEARMAAVRLALVAGTLDRDSEVLSW